MWEFTQADIDNAVEVAKRWECIQEQLDGYCRAVVEEMDLDLDELPTINTQNGTVSIKTVWYGGYQSRDYDHFSFPVSRLLESPVEVAKTLKEEKRKEAEALQAVRKQEQEKQEYAKLLELQEKFKNKEKP